MIRRAGTAAAAMTSAPRPATSRHVFVIVLENKTFSDTFGTSTQDPYLQKTLVSQGALLTEYYGTGHVSLDNYISMVSGQSPTPDTVDDCIPGLVVPPGQFNDVEETGIGPVKPGDRDHGLRVSRARKDAARPAAASAG